MPAWNVNVDESASPLLSSFAPSYGESLKAAVSSTFEENISTLGYDYFSMRNANAGEKLEKGAAEGMVKEAGLKLKIPEDGYTRDALSLLIERQQNSIKRQSVTERTPWSWLGTPTRGAAMLLTGITDPLNVASAFIPVVGEARAATLLARATGLGRLGTRAAIGAAEGAVGAAILEPAVYGLHQGLQDDYHMVDSLLNVGFGAALGGGLHAAGGTVADALRVGRDPYSRFAALDREQVARVLEYEKLTRKGEKPSSDTWSPAMRQAAGLEPPTAARVMDMATPEAREAALRTAVADMVNGRMPDVEAVVRYDRDAKAPEVWYTGSPEAGMQTTRGLAEQSTRGNANEQFAGPGHYTSTSRDLAGTYGGPTGRVYELPRSFQNAFDLNTVSTDRKSGKTVYDEMVKTLGSKAAANAELQRQGYDAITFTSPRGEKIANVFDELPLVDVGAAREPKAPMRELSLVDRVKDAKSTADRQASPETVALGSPESSKAAGLRIAEAPKEHTVEAARAELADAMKRVDDLQKNLELSGIKTEKLAWITDGLRKFDEAINDASRIGRAIVQNAMCGLRA